MPPPGETVTTEMAAIVFTAVSCTLFLSWFFWKLLADNRKIFYRVMSRHNREDDDYFALLYDMARQAEIRDALHDGVEPPARKPLPRRRYLFDPGEGVQEMAE